MHKAGARCGSLTASGATLRSSAYATRLALAVAVPAHVEKPRDATPVSTTLVTRRSCSGVTTCLGTEATHAGGTMPTLAMRARAHRQNSVRSQSAQVTGRSCTGTPWLSS
jgi:hypothetical protein